MRLNGNTKSDADRGGPFRRFASGSTVALTLLGAVAFAPTSAQAVASFDVLNDLTVTITGDAAALEIDVTADLFNDVYGDGTGTAQSTATINGVPTTSIDTDPTYDPIFGDSLVVDANGAFDFIGVGDAVNLTAAANGFAGDTLPGPETFFADSINQLDFTVRNFGTETTTVRFNWDLIQQASVNTQVFGETADAFSEFTLFGSVFDVPGGADVTAPDRVFDEFGNDIGFQEFWAISDVTAFAFDGLSDSSGVLTTSSFIDVVLGANQGVTFVTAWVDSFGSATGEVGVPEPGILPLLGIGLLAVGFTRRRA